MRLRNRLHRCSQTNCRVHRNRLSVDHRRSRSIAADILMRTLHQRFSADVNILEARIAITLDFLWVVGTGILIALGILSTPGNWGTAVAADVVLFFAIVQYVGLRRLSPNPAF